MSTQDDVPVVCETCLGTNPYLKMMRERNGLECKLCTRPFTVFKWAPIKNGALKHTIICITCARQRNCCQSCLLDLTYGIPIQLRDAALKMAGVEGLANSNEPTNEISKLYVANNSDKFDKLGGASITSDSDKAKEILTKLALASKNKVPKSSKTKENELPQHIEKIDVTKIVSKLPFNGSLTPPEKDPNLATLFVFGIDQTLPEYKITDYFEQYGKIKSFQCQHKARCGFITFTKRSDAEKAAEALKITSPKGDKPGLLILESTPLRVTWGKERTLGKTNGENLKVGSIVAKLLKKLSRSENTSSNTSTNKKRAITESSTNDQDKESSEARPSKKTVISSKPAQERYKSLSKNYEL